MKISNYIYECETKRKSMHLLRKRVQKVQRSKIYELLLIIHKNTSLNFSFKSVLDLKEKLYHISKMKNDLISFFMKMTLLPLHPKYSSLPVIVSQLSGTKCLLSQKNTKHL